MMTRRFGVLCVLMLGLVALAMPSQALADPPQGWFDAMDAALDAADGATDAALACLLVQNDSRLTTLWSDWNEYADPIANVQEREDFEAAMEGAFYASMAGHAYFGGAEADVEDAINCFESAEMSESMEDWNSAIFWLEESIPYSESAEDKYRDAEACYELMRTHLDTAEAVYLQVTQN